MFSISNFKFTVSPVAGLPVATPRGLPVSDPLEHVLSVPQSHIRLRLKLTAISVVGLPSADNISSKGEKRTNLIPSVRFHVHTQQQEQMKVQLSLRSVNTTP
jgi:hypothetical protein